jgi:formate hydrogenlyase subunit 6/NADH:ubiquinone oxidoreductase subunit I
MAIAFKNFARPPITLQYPHEKMELPERSRWAVAPKFDAEGNPKCRACLACVRACPDFVLALEATTDPETKVKHIESFNYQLGACMLCGLCVEACPFDALEMSHDYELARIDASELAYDLLANVDAAMPPKRDAAPKPAAPADATPKPADAAPAPTADATPAPAPAAEPAPAPAAEAAAPTPEAAPEEGAQ